MQNEVLTIRVEITGQQSVKGEAGEANMIAFTGDVDCASFRGKILPGGVDTQIKTAAGLSLSARYILEGTDAAGNYCRVFIENNGTATDPSEPMRTNPILYTDSPCLKYLETAELSGKLEPNGASGVLIHISCTSDADRLFVTAGGGGTASSHQPV